MDRLEAIGRLQIVQPVPSALTAVTKAMNATRDSFRLSSADIEILAVAFMYHKDGEIIVLLTDDYSIQNVAALLSIPFQAYRQKGIQAMWNWEIYCPGCYSVFKEGKAGDACPNCHTPLKRRRKEQGTPKSKSK